MRELIYYRMRGKLPCIFKAVTGLDCPGCGGTRAAKALLHGRLILSFFYHPVVLYMGIMAAVFFISWLLSRIMKNDKYRIPFTTRYVYIGIAIIIANFLIKNYFILVKGIDILELLPKI